MQQDEQLSRKPRRSMAWGHPELCSCSSNNSNGGHFAERSYCKHNGCTRSAVIARGAWEHKWGLVYYISIALSLPALAVRTCYLSAFLFPSPPNLIPRTLAAKREEARKLQPLTRIFQLVNVTQCLVPVLFLPLQPPTPFPTHCPFSTLFPTPKSPVRQACPTLLFYSQLPKPSYVQHAGKNHSSTNVSVIFYAWLPGSCTDSILSLTHQASYNSRDSWQATQRRGEAG